MTDSERLISAYDAVSAFIEKHTQALCPDCETVCCIDRHGTYEKEDRALLRALDVEPAPDAPKDADTEPCRFLTRNGCRLPRIMRPFRCTWYFCSRLLEEMPHDNSKKYREFVAALGRLQRLRRELLIV